VNKNWQNLLLIVLAIAVGYLIWKGRNQLALQTARVKALSKPLPNPKLLETPKTKLLAFKAVVKTAGVPVQLPYGKPTRGEVRLSTAGNSGNVYLGDSYSTVKDGILRFTIPKDKEFNYKITDLSSLFLDADNDNDGLGIISEVLSG